MKKLCSIPTRSICTGVHFCLWYEEKSFERKLNFWYWWFIFCDRDDFKTSSSRICLLYLTQQGDKKKNIIFKQIVSIDSKKIWHPSHDMKGHAVLLLTSVFIPFFRTQYRYNVNPQRHFQECCLPKRNHFVKCFLLRVHERSSYNSLGSKLLKFNFVQVCLSTIATFNNLH